jgi:DNA polymerase III delta prime subunit
MAREAEYRNALQVSPERIKNLSDIELSVLMRELLYAQAYRCGAPVKEIIVNTEGKAKDDGCDGWSPRPVSEDPWLGSVKTCWQFKAGSSGEPAQLAGEITKPIPRKTLAEGGRFVLVASSSANGIKGVEARLEKLREEAQAASLPTRAIEVFGSERLTIWCNQHPAKAMRWAGRPEGLWRLEDWIRSDDHQVPWHATAAVEKLIDDRRSNLDFHSGSIIHLHIQGPPGVGKTRLALELCRNAAWSEEVVYVRQATDIRLLEILDGAVSEDDVQLVVVADEVQWEQLRPLRDSVGRSHGRVRLITIGHSKTSDPERIPALQVMPLETDPMVAVIKGWHSGMPIEHAQFVARFADGYVRLAHLAANAIARNPTMNVRELLDLDHIRAVLDRMLGDGNRRALHVVAALSHVGWYEDLQLEGKSIARHLDQDWNMVREKVEEFHRRFGIVPRGGRYRYISPTPLGIYLAVEAWTIYPDLLKTLPSALPSDEARDSYYERLQTIASNPQAGEFARAELSFFFQIDDFVDGRAVRRWSALSAADPGAAARILRGALLNVEPEARERVKDSARREAVWTLVRLAWNPIAFHDAVIALALLAEAENETWANNATGEFLARFQIFLGGTAVPYPERLLVLDELLAIDRPALTRLVVRALSKVGDQQATRMGSDPIPGELPQPEWRPKTGPEHLKCFTEALGRLQTIAMSRPLHVQDDLIAGARNLGMLLRNKALRTFVINFFDAVRETYPDARESLRRVIADILYREKKYWKQLSSDDLQALEELHAQYEDASLPARLRQFVGQASWHRDEQIDLTPLATELFRARPMLAAEWPWLTSGQASDAWRLGQALATVDHDGELENILPALEGRGPDLRLICGYIHRRRELCGAEWLERWITKELQRNPTDMPLLFEVTWRCGATPNIVREITKGLHQGDVDANIVGQLAFGAWSDGLPTDVMIDLVQTLSDRGHVETAIAILEHQLSATPEELEAWDKIALKLVLNGKVIRSREMANHYWNELASRLAPRHAGAIAAAILREHADRTSGTWFLEFSEACVILQNTIEHDASGVWEVLKQYLSSATDAMSFSIGFPRGVVDQLHREEIWNWVAEAPETRAKIMARFVAKDFSHDNTLAALMIGTYGDIEKVSSAFFSEYLSGGWTGSSSDHWDTLASRVDEVAHRTSLPKLSRWATDAARSLRQMAERDRQREEEDDLRGK